jgi:hypothetical protein
MDEIDKRIQAKMDEDPKCTELKAMRSVLNEVNNERKTAVDELDTALQREVQKVKQDRYDFVYQLVSERESFKHMTCKQCALYFL